MAKIKGPLLSLSATGTVADTTTFAKWKGIPYVRQKVNPANPRTTAQVATRSVFGTAAKSWRRVPALFTEVWNDFILGRPLTGRNAYMGKYTENLRGETDLAQWQTSPGTRSGPAIPSLNGDTGAASGEIDMTYTAPTLPTGWTLDEIRFVYVPDQDPSTEWVETVQMDQDTTLNGTWGLTGLTPATVYAVSAYPKFTKDNGQTAFGASTTVLVTSTA